MDLHRFIRDIPDFPKPGILFKDITPLLLNAEAFSYVIETLSDRYRNEAIDKIVGIESRGFIFGAAMANHMKKGFIPMRKPGKLPAETISQSFDLEYGKDTLEIHRDALKPSESVLIVDDVLATGGTLEAAIQLVEKAGGRAAEVLTVVELTFLKGRERLKNEKLFSLLQF